MGNKLMRGLIIALLGIVTFSLLPFAGEPAAAATNKKLQELPPLKPKTMPDLLTEAGFKSYPAETSQEKEYLTTTPKGTMLIEQQIGRVFYFYLDPDSNTVYMGNFSSYSYLQDLLKRRGLELPEKRIDSDEAFWKTWGHRYGGY